MARKPKMAVELVSEIGQRAADLSNACSEEAVRAAVKFLVEVNPDAFRYLRDQLIAAIPLS